MEYLILLAIPLAFICLVSGIFTAVVARSKQRSTPDWFLAGVFFPLISLIAIAGMAPAKPKPPREPLPWGVGVKTFMLVVGVGSLLMVAVSLTLY